MHGNVFDSGLSGRGMRFALVVARFNQNITFSLRDWCVKALIKHEVAQSDIEIVVVPGSFEIPLVCKMLARSEKYDGVIALGAVVRGETPHFDYVSKEVSDGVARASYENEVPVIFGVVTTNNMKQAEERARQDESNKGYEAGLAAIEMAQLMRRIKN